eukprot:10385175-Heterocapsa_arctica.AAC.1
MEYGQQPYRLKKLMLQASVWRQRVETLGVGPQTRFSKVRRGRAGAQGKDMSHGAVGCRAKGGGRCSSTSNAIDLVETFIDEVLADQRAGSKELQERAEAMLEQ